MTAVAVCSGKGSPGATFVAVNLAATLSRKGDDVLLVDFDLSGGDIAAYLGLDPRKGLHLLAKLAGPNPSHEHLRAEVQKTEGIGVIGGLPKSDGNGSIDPLFVAKRCKTLGSTVIFDVGRIPGPSIQTMEHVDRVLIVVRPDVISVLGAERCLAALESCSLPKERIELVITAHRRRRLAELVEVGSALDCAVAGVIPWVPGAARRALESQHPIRSGGAARAFDALAARHTDPVQPVVTRPMEAVGV